MRDILIFMGLAALLATFNLVTAMVLTAIGIYQADKEARREEEMEKKKWYMDYIVFVPYDAEPFLKGTRISVRTVVLQMQVSNCLKEVTLVLPTLSTKQVEAALAYYKGNKQYVDKFIRENS